jgi:hypothetical protein
MTMTESDRNVDVYRVGVLAALYRDWRMVTVVRRRPVHLAQEVRYLLRQAKAHNWRAIRNSFNGFLAEHRYAGTRCGHAWTRKRALADLRRHLDQIAAERTAGGAR